MIFREFKTDDILTAAWVNRVSKALGKFDSLAIQGFRRSDNSSSLAFRKDERSIVGAIGAATGGPNEIEIHCHHLHIYNPKI